MNSLPQSSQTAFHEQQINEPELGDDELFSALHEDLPEGIDGMTDFDIFNDWPETRGGGGQSPSGSPRRPEGSPLCGDGPGSGVGNHDGPGSPYSCSNTPRVHIQIRFMYINIYIYFLANLLYLINTFFDFFAGGKFRAS